MRLITTLLLLLAVSLSAQNYVRVSKQDSTAYDYILSGWQYANPRLVLDIVSESPLEIDSLYFVDVECQMVNRRFGTPDTTDYGVRLYSVDTTSMMILPTTDGLPEFWGDSVYKLNSEAGLDLK